MSLLDDLVLFEEIVSVCRLFSQWCLLYCVCKLQKILSSTLPRHTLMLEATLLFGSILLIPAECLEWVIHQVYHYVCGDCVMVLDFIIHDLNSAQIHVFLTIRSQGRITYVMQKP